MSARVMVCVPAYGGHVLTQFFMSCLRMQEELTKVGILVKFGTLSFPDICEVRNIFTTIFYDRTDATHLLFCDSDMSYDPKLILDMINFDQPLVGVIPTKKKYPIEFVGRASIGNPMDPATFDGFMKVDGVGGGILLISRDCIGEMLRQMPDIIDPYPLDLHPASELIKSQGLNRLLRPFDAIINHEIGRLSEDLSFSNRWLRCGGEVWANIEHEIGHVGYHEFRASYGSFLRDRKQAATGVTA